MAALCTFCNDFNGDKEISKRYPESSVKLLPSIIKTGNRRNPSRSENFSAINPIILHIQSRQYGYDFYESVFFFFVFLLRTKILQY